MHRARGSFGEVVVVDQDGLRHLRSPGIDGVDQSVIVRGRPGELPTAYLRAAALGTVLAAKLERVLLVGLGGGAFARFLRRRFPRAAIDVVEVDPVMVALAREYFGFREDRRLALHVGDGAAFVEARQHAVLSEAREGVERAGESSSAGSETRRLQTDGGSPSGGRATRRRQRAGRSSRGSETRRRQRASSERGAAEYDFVLLDAYAGPRVPRALASRAFFARVAALLAPGGIAAANVGHPDRRTEERFLRRFAAAFPGGSFVVPVPVEDNRVAFGARDPWPGRARLLDQAACADETGPLPFAVSSLLRRRKRLSPPH